ncbi:MULTISPECIES: hypothetical protein [Comamonas]|uniref:hypothetical protein n=1 Tax=Comamonas TaxID=283 RepID=UPI000621DF26|nr:MULTISPECIES: hypothetical protein [Comamonas]KKI11822.1 hypothetical protein XA67_22605 [Comamonas thiooxydans]TYK72086.1 hypothetical protein FSY45_22450 [Comamonas sp. Z1]BCX53860.1 hypothetical protein CTYAZ2_34400 [Comamonas testosteroni]
MNLWNPFAFDVLGRPVAAAVPPSLRVEGGPASTEQRAMAQQVFARYVSQARLSQVPNPTQLGKLADGTAYRIVSVAGQHIMQIWPAQSSRRVKVDSGILFSQMQSGEIWLLVNELVDGRLSAKWVFRNIAQEYSAPEKSDIFSLQGMTDRAIAVPGGWGYSYAAQDGQGLGRYGYLNVFTPLSTGDYPGELMHVSPGGAAVFVNTLVSGARTMRQSVLKKGVSDLSPPPFGSNAQTTVIKQEVAADSQELSVDTPGFIDVVGLFPLPNPSNRQYHVVSPNGKYLAVVVERYAGRRSTIVGPLVYAPDYFEIRRDMWPGLSYSRGDAVLLTLTTYPTNAGPAEYEETEQVIKTFRAGNFGYEPVADEVLPSIPSAFTPTISRVIGNVVQSATRAGFAVSQQYWPHPQLISAASSEGTSKWRVFAIHSETNTYKIRKSSEIGTSQLIGITDSGEPVIQDDRDSVVYEVDYSRPTDSNHEMVSFQEPPPRVGVDLISGDVEVVNNESGSYESKFKYHAKNSRKYSHGPEIITSERYVEGVKSGTFYQNRIRGEEVNSGSAQVQYTSRVVVRQVMLQRLTDGLLVFYEHSAELSHQSSSSYGPQGPTKTPSRSIPIRKAQVTIWYRGEVTTFPVVPGRAGYPGYANIGRNITELGEELYASQNMLEDTEPIGHWDVENHTAKSDFLSTQVDEIVAPLSIDNLLATAVCAKCPQTPGMLLEIAVGSFPDRQIWRFLVDPVAGVREAESVLPWPQAARNAPSFYPF